MREFLYKIKHFIVKSYKTFKKNNNVKIVCANSYYPEMKRKSSIHRLIDLLFWFYRYGEVAEFYNLYGLDITGKKVKSSNFINYNKFMIERNNRNKNIQLLRDKYLFFKVIDGASIKTPYVFEKVSINTPDDLNKLFSDYADKDVFVKSISGECADGVYHLKPNCPKPNIPLGGGEYIVQERLFQHKDINALYDGAVNTVRIVTVIDSENNVSVFSSGLRIGSKKTGSVDNWAAGGAFVGIKDGKLKKYGYLKPKYTGKIEVHPDTNIRFENYPIPFYNEIVTLVKKAHLLFPDNMSIGWDIAITPEGPAIIEGNDNWEISLMQVGEGNGLKNQWQEVIKNYDN